jgi:hypothetical protein
MAVLTLVLILLEQFKRTGLRVKRRCALLTRCRGVRMSEVGDEGTREGGIEVLAKFSTTKMMA